MQNNPKRRLFLVLGVLLIVFLAIFYYPKFVDKPVKDGPGPLSVYIAPEFAAPEYHSPLDYWQTHHTDIVNRGDLPQSDCLHCHEPERSCNNCHSYVGANQIVK